MFKSYFIVATRNLVREKGINILNIVGLSISIAAGLIIAIHIRGELSYDTSFKDHESIYRLHREGWAASSPALAMKIEKARELLRTRRRDFAPGADEQTALRADQVHPDAQNQRGQIFRTQVAVHLKQFGVPAVVAINHFAGDTEADAEAVRAAYARIGRDDYEDFLVRY